jgi:group I intron endonuclease
MEIEHLPRSSGIYIIECSVSGKFYVGSAKILLRRGREHRAKLLKGTHTSTRLQRAWDKRGPTAFSIRVLTLLPNPSMLIAHEQRWIDDLSAVAKGYNAKPIADSCLGSKRTEETKAKQRAAQLGKRHTPEAIARMRAAHSNRAPFSKETRARMSATSTGRVHTAETRAKIRAANLGAKRNPEAREAMRRAQLGKRRGPMSDQHRAAISAGHARRWALRSQT